MSKLKTYFNLYRLINIVLFLVGLTVYCILHFFWADICVSLDCSTYVMGAYLAPIREAGLVLAAATLPLLFFPARYFKKWFVFIFLPASLLTLWNVSSIDPNESHSFLVSATRQSAMENFLILWPVVTLIFIAVHWYKNRQQ